MIDAQQLDSEEISRTPGLENAAVVEVGFPAASQTDFDFVRSCSRASQLIFGRTPKLAIWCVRDERKSVLVSHKQTDLVEVKRLKRLGTLI